MKSTWPESVKTIDSHTAGEGTRLLIEGLPDFSSKTMDGKLAEAQELYPWLPSALLLEPRGHKDLYGALLTDPCQPGADFGVLFMNNQGYEPMCGHALIGTVTSLLETSLIARVEPETCLIADTPAGLIPIRAQIEAGCVTNVSFENVPSFTLALDYPLKLENGAQFLVDIAFGGNFFVLVDGRQIDIPLTPKNTPRLTDLGMQLLKAANNQFKVAHPFLPQLDQITDVRFYNSDHNPEMVSRNIVILGESMVDRSPCGTGTCAELAVRYARGGIKIGQPLISESILGTKFRGVVLHEVNAGYRNQKYPVIVPLIEGRAFLTGMHKFLFKEEDPFKQGFLLN